MKILKNIGVVVLSIIFVVCLAVDIAYIFILKKAPVKNIVKTFNVGTQELNDGTTKEFIELNYFSNKKKNGIECFEIKFNYLSDENKNMFYSQGLQYVSTNDDPIGFNYYYSNATSSKKTYKVEKSFGSKSKYYDYWGNFNPNNNTKEINYASSDDGVTSTFSTNPLDKHSKFLIELDGKLFRMSFKSIDRDKQPYKGKVDGIDVDNSALWNKHFIGRESKRFENYLFYYVFSYSDYFYNYDINYFSSILKNAVSSLKDGTSQQIVFEFGDIFDYQEYDEKQKVYYSLSNEDSLKVQETMKSYYCIKVNYSDNGITKYNQSLFNNVDGSPNYNTSGDYSLVQYLYGRSVIDVSYGYFTLIKSNNGNYNLVLKDEFVQQHLPCKDIIILNVILDKQEFDKHNISVNKPECKDFKIIEDNFIWPIKINHLDKI